MSIVEGLTREQIRQRVGDQVKDFFLGTTTSAPGDATSVIDTSAYGGEDDWGGSWIRFFDGTLDGETSRVSSFNGTTGDHTVSPAFTGNVPSGANYERWSPDYHPERVDRFINQAISEIVGRFYVSEESLALHGDGVTSRFDIPSEFDAIRLIEYRKGHRSELVHNGATTFDETTDADFTQVVDTEDQKDGQSLKITVAAAASAGDFISDSIGAIDLSKYTHLEGWVKSTVALSAADYKIHLDSGTVLANGTDLESLNLPAVSADTWTFFRIALANPELDTAIISIGIEMDVDKGAHVIWFDAISAVDNNSGRWVPLNDICWKIDREAGDLVLSGPGVTAVGNSLMKIHGGSIPAQMTTDSAVATVAEDYLVFYTLAMLLYSGSRASNDDPEGRRTQADRFFALAERAKSKMRLPAGTRKIR